MRHHLHRYLWRTVGIAVPIPTNPGGKFDGGGIHWKFFPERDAALRIKFAEVGWDGVP